MTELEKKLNAMSPAERKKAVDHISNQMGMNPDIEKRARASSKKKTSSKSTAKKPTAKKK